MHQHTELPGSSFTQHPGCAQEFDEPDRSLEFDEPDRSLEFDEPESDLEFDEPESDLEFEALPAVRFAEEDSWGDFRCE